MLSAFVGREQELAEIRELVGSARLVTLTGAGGSGKTRLALQAAAELLGWLGDGVWLVDLAPLTEDDQVARAVAAVLGLPDSGDSGRIGRHCADRPGRADPAGQLRAPDRRRVPSSSTR